MVFGLVLLGSRGLWSPDEGRYVGVAVGMLDSGDWLTPRVHPEFEHFTKPPMTYWAVASSVGVFGRNEWAARLPMGLAWLGTLWLLVRVSRRLNGSNGLLAGVIFALMPLPYLAADLVTTDPLLCLWETLLAFAFVHLRFARDEAESSRMRLLLGIAAGLAFLTKGPPGLLPLLAFVVFAATVDGWSGIRRLYSWASLLVGVAIGLSWYAAVVIHEPALLHHFLVDEVWNRVASGKMHRNEQWYGALRVYLPTLLLGMLPASLWLLWRLLRRGLAIRSLWRNRHEEPRSWLIALWIGLPLLIFALSRSRLPLYLLPLAPPIALLAERLLPERLPRLACWGGGVLLALALVGVRLYAARLDHSLDDRAFAAALSNRFDGDLDQVAEIVFVEAAPRLGLKFYLRREVERLYLPGVGVVEPQSQSLASEVLEDEGCRLLFTDEENLEATRAALAAYPHRDLGLVRGYTLFSLDADRCNLH